MTGRKFLSAVVLISFLASVAVATRPSPVRAEGGGALVAEPVLAASAEGVRQLFGASPAEAAGEVWGVGTEPGGAPDIVRYTEADGWEALAPPTEEDGAPVSGMEIPETATAGRTTAAGGVVTAAKLGTAASGEHPEAILVRNPGGEFRAVAPPEGTLEEGEQLYAYAGPESAFSIRLAAVEEPDGRTGAFIVPEPKVRTINTEVLHYDGSDWSREPICLKPAPAPCELPKKEKFRVLAVDASGLDNAWLLAEQPASTFNAKLKKTVRSGQSILLFRREGDEWRRQALGGALGLLYSEEGAQEVVEGGPVFVKVREPEPASGKQLGQPLTVTSNGLWIDVTIGVVTESTTSDGTIYFDTGEGDVDKSQVTGAWCSLPSTTAPAVTAALCTGELPFDLAQGQSRSFAWPGSGIPGDPNQFGTRAITGIGKGAMLLFENGGFTRIPLAGNGGSSAGAAIAYPEKEGRGAGLGIEGWLGPSYRLARAPVPAGLTSWPVPFRRPLTAIASQPGAPVGEIGTQALAVGEAGQVARYLPGVGWQPESMLTGSGARATPNLRAVAWPVSGFAYAVGDEGAMWIWRSATGFWEPDPGAPPNLVRGNFTGIAFDPDDPERGYAVGQQGLLLAYGRRWTQEPLPPEIGSEPNITSIAFAGNEAIATWSQSVPSDTGGTAPTKRIGGVIVNTGSGGWQTVPQASEALQEAEGPQTHQVSPRLVAGLPDGGAVIAGSSGAIIEREGPGVSWHAVPGAPLGVPVALQAIREGGQVRALVSVEANAINASQGNPGAVETPQGVVQVPEGQAPLLLEPYPLPASGYIVRQTADGWRDEERQSYPIPPKPTDQESGTRMDIPRVPDPVLAFLTNPDGSQGWAVGGQTGQMATSTNSGAYEQEGLLTASVMRIGESATAPQNASEVPIPVSSSEATFAVGGNAQCADVCADLSGTGIGPDVWLRAAVGKAAATPGVRAFLYTGSSVAGGLVQSRVTPHEFGEEEAAYARRLGSAAGALPVFTSPAQTDVYESSLGTFGKEFEDFGQPLGTGAPGAGVVPRSDADPAEGRYFYSFDSEGAYGGPVRVIVLDLSVEPPSTEEQCWLSAELTGAANPESPRPAIVLGNREVGANTSLRQLIVTGANEMTAASCPQTKPTGASAYFFDSPEANTKSELGWGVATIPAYGTGSLGYLSIPNLKLNQYGAASGFLLASVDTSALNPANNVAPVTARLIPSIGALAINALDGTLLRRSQVALFEALARRPVAGFYCAGNSAPQLCESVKPNPYVQIPARCVKQLSCSTEVLPEYRFTSSRPDIANFVKVDPSSSSPRAVFLNGEGKPEPDPTSGLLCAFNSGTTTVSVEAGGLAYSVQVTVQKGSVARPCGTVPRTDIVTPPPPVTPPPVPSEAPPPSQSPRTTFPAPHAPPVPVQAPPLTPTPVAPAPLPTPHPLPAKPPVPLQPPFFVNSPGIAPLPVIVPPAPPAAAEPAPPTGTSPVTQPAVSPEPEREEEAAFDLVHHAVAVRHGSGRAAGNASYMYKPRSGHIPWLIYALPTLVVIAALSSSGMAGRRRRREPEPAFLQTRR